MNEITPSQSDDTLHHKHPNKQDQIPDTSKKQTEIMTPELGIFTRLAKYYYGTQQPKDYTEYTGEDAETASDAHLYTIIKYEGTNTVVQIGTGAFNTAVFTRRNIPELKGFFYGPLPLFVVPSRADEEYKKSDPKTFLNEHAILYSPKGGQIIARQKDHDIDYGQRNGILNYPDAILALQNAQIHKTFPNDTMLKTFTHKMKELKDKTDEELQKRTKFKQEYFKDDYKARETYTQMLACLQEISDGNQDKMRDLFTSFDPHQKAFINDPRKQAFTKGQQ